MSLPELIREEIILFQPAIHPRRSPSDEEQDNMVADTKKALEGFQSTQARLMIEIG